MVLDIVQGLFKQKLFEYEVAPNYVIASAIPLSSQRILEERNKYYATLLFAHTP